MTEVARLSVAIGADTSDLKKGMADADSAVKGFGSSLSSIVGGIGLGIGTKVFDAVVGGLGAAKNAAIDLNSMLEQSKVAFTTMLGSEKAADDFLREMANFAKSTPFEFPDLVEASKQMFAFGFAAKEVKPLLTAVGDSVAAVGGGAETIEGVTRALGQMRAKGKVSAEEMAQLAERGIPAWDMLAKKMGLSTAEVMKLSEKGLIPAQTMIDAFIEGSASRFGGMMDKQSRTFAGAMSTITDSLQMAVATGFKPMFDFISEGVVALAGLLSSDTFEGWGSAVSQGMQKVVDWIRQGLSSAAELWRQWGQPILTTVTGWFTTLQTQGLAPFLAQIGQWISGAVPQLGSMFARWAEAAVWWIERAIPQMLTKLGELISGVFGWITTNAPLIASKLAEWGSALVNWLVTAGPDLLARLGQVAAQVVTWLVDASGFIARHLLEWATAFVAWVTPMIPQLLSALGQAIAGVINWIVQNAPAIASQLLEWARQFWAWVQPAIGPLISALGQLLTSLGSWIISTALPAILMQLAQWGAAFVGWVAASLPGLMSALASWLTTVTTWMTSTAWPAIKQAAQNWAAAYTEWAAPAGEQLKQQLTTDSQSLWAAIIDIYTNARKEISTRVAEANRYDEAEHKAFLDRMRSDAQQLWQQYVSVQDNVWKTAQQTLQQIWAAIQQIHRAFLDDLVNAFPQRMNSYLAYQRQVWGDVQRIIEGAFNSIGQIHRQFWNGLVEAARSAAQQISSQVSNMINSINRLIDRIRSIPSFGGSGRSYSYASGGVLTEPVVGYGLRTGSQYTLAESGPERVTPLGQTLSSFSPMSSATGVGVGSGASGGSRSAAALVNTLNVIVQGHALVDKRAIADAVVIGLEAAQQQSRTRIRVV